MSTKYHKFHFTVERIEVKFKDIQQFKSWHWVFSLVINSLPILTNWNYCHEIHSFIKCLIRKYLFYTPEISKHLCTQ